MSSGINDRTDEYGGSLENRARFLLNVIEAIRGAVGRDFHLQVKLSAVDHNNVIPWEKPGNTLADTVTIAKWAEAAGADAIHVSQGSLFPHPLNPPGDLSLETLTTTYDAMISSGVHGMRNYLLFRYPLLRPIFHWVWFRMKKGKPIEGVNLEEARELRRRSAFRSSAPADSRPPHSFARRSIPEAWTAFRLRARSSPTTISSNNGPRAPIVPRSPAPTATAAWSAR